MKKILLFILFSIVTIVKPQSGADYCSELKIQSFSNNNRLSKVNYPGDSNIDVTYYKLNLKISINPSKYLYGIVTVKAKPVDQPLNSFYLDLKNNMVVTSVKQNGSDIPFSQAETDKLNITLDRTYQPNEEFTVDITYGGFPNTGSDPISQASFTFKTHGNDDPAVSSLSEPYGSKVWWPCKDTPGDKVDSSDVWITADPFFYSVSNGKLVGIIDNADQTKTYKWHNSHPIANYLISIAMTNYAMYSSPFTYNGLTMPVIHYCYPENLTDQRKSVLDKTLAMLKIYSDKFGIYPYMNEKYGHAEFFWSGGMEHQTVTSMGSGALNNEYVIAHELGHQWFGDKVTCKDWHHIWLNEGFASYCECIYVENMYGEESYKNYIDNFMNNHGYGAKTAIGTIYVQDITKESEIFNSARTIIQYRDYRRLSACCRKSQRNGSRLFFQRVDLRRKLSRIQFRLEL